MITNPKGQRKQQPNNRLHDVFKCFQQAAAEMSQSKHAEGVPKQLALGHRRWETGGMTVMWNKTPKEIVHVHLSYITGLHSPNIKWV